MSSRSSSNCRSKSSSCKKSSCKKDKSCSRLRLQVEQTLLRSFTDDQGFSHFVLQVALTNEGSETIKRLSVREELVAQDGGCVIVMGTLISRGDPHVVVHGVNTGDQEWLSTGELLKEKSSLPGCASAVIVYELIYIASAHLRSLVSSLMVSGLVKCDQQQSLFSSLPLELPSSVNQVTPAAVVEPICLNWRGREIGDPNVVKLITFGDVTYNVRIIDWVARAGFPKQFIQGNVVVSDQSLKVTAGIANGPGGRAPIVIAEDGGVFNSPLSLSFSPDEEQAFRGIEFCFAPEVLWSINTVAIDGVNQPVQRTLIAEVNGLPAVLYIGTQPSLGMKYAYAADPAGSSWTIVNIPLPFNEIYALKVIAGRPAIIYRDELPPSTRIRYLRANDAAGSSWPNVAQVVAQGPLDQIGQADLVEINGRPGVAFYDLENSQVAYAYGSKADGTSWTTVSAAPGVISNLTDEISVAAMGSGQVAVAYFQDVDVKYVFSPTAGASWGTPQLVGSSSPNRTISLISIGGVPSIVYNDSSNTLIYAYASNADGSIWNFNFITDYIGQDVSLALVNDLPAVAYTTMGFLLQYAYASDLAGSSWAVVTALDPSAAVTRVSLANIQGNAGIAYFTNGQVKYAYGQPC